MCRAKDNGGRRCPCEQPEIRRARQRLGYALQTAQSAVETLPEASGDLIAEVDSIHEPVDVELLKAMAATLNSDVPAMGEKVLPFFLGDGENTPENLAYGVAARENQVLMIGEEVAARADEIAGMTSVEAYNQWQTRLQEAEKAVEDFDNSEKMQAIRAANNYNAEMFAKYSIDNVGDLHAKMTDAEYEHWKVLRRANNNAYKELSLLESNASKILYGKDEESQRVVEAFAAANRQAIKEIRSVGEAAPQVKEHQKNKGTAEFFTSSIQEVFPTAWIENSNAMGEVLLKESPKRAHYNFQAVQRKRVREVHTEQEIRRADWKPDPRDITKNEWKVIDPGSDYNEWEGPVYEQYRSGWRSYAWDSEKGQPKGSGWVKGEHAVETYQDGKIVVEYEEGWFRKMSSLKTVEEKTQAEIRLMKTRDSEAAHVAVHEFAHRCEDSNPHLKVLEERFLTRRTTNADGTREKLVRYGSGTPAEYVREDSFVNIYMGKQYEQDNREILSMGSEAVFSGTNGGLLGIGTQRKDPEMRSFILGLYASM